MATLKDFKAQQRFTLLQYGETGTGKSYRAAAAVAFGPIYIFDFDNKIQSVFEWYKDRPDLIERIHYDTYADHGGTIDSCQKVYLKLQEFWAMVRAGTFPYATIVWDSWTAWEQVYLNQVIKSNPKFERMGTEVYTDPATKTKQYIYTPQQADYRIHAHNEQQFITELTHFPCNIIVNSHISVKQDESTGKIERGMAAAGKLAKLLPKFFTEVHRCFVDGKNFRCQIRSDTMWPCNTRLQVPDSGTIDPDIKHLAPFAMQKAN